MLAIGATHLSYLEATRRLSSATETYKLSLQYRETAMSLLRQGRLISAELSHDAFLAACIMLVDNDILSANVGWRQPLRFGKEAIMHRGSPGNMLFGPNWRNLVSQNAPLPPPAAIPRYLIEHAVLQDVFGEFVGVCGRTGRARRACGACPQGRQPARPTATPRAAGTCRS